MDSENRILLKSFLGASISVAPGAKAEELPEDVPSSLHPWTVLPALEIRM
jgi:hypothetical protein